MQNLHFKTSAYRFYAPYLYKIKRFWAKYLGRKWQFNNAQKTDLINFYWDKFLALKFYQEVPYYPGKKFSFEQVERSSDTLFVLGCGSSINDLTNTDWETIKKHDSIGVNYFYAHAFCPTFHMIELGQSPLSLNCLNDNLLNNKARKNEQVFMQIRHIIRRKSGTLSNANGNLYLYSPAVPKSKSSSVITKIVARWYSKPNCLFHHASNLDCTIHFAYQAGYKKIYLLGVDLNNNQYFWDNASEPTPALVQIKAAATDDYERSNFNKNPSAKHATADKTKTATNNSLTVVEYLQIVNEEIFKKKGIKFATCSPHSLLREHFDYVALETLKK